LHTRHYLQTKRGMRCAFAERRPGYGNARRSGKGKTLRMNRIQQILCGVAIVLLALAALPGQAAAVENWLPIPPEDLALKDNPKQPGADAMILYRDVVIDASKAGTDGESAEEYVRIKVFTQAGVGEGHVNIAFVKDDETIPYIAGRTIRPDGTVVKFDGQVLETTIEKFSGLKVLAKSFTLPDVQPGCIIEYIFQRQTRQHYVSDRTWQVSQSMYTREVHFNYMPYRNSDLRLTYNTYMLPPDVALKEQANGTYTMVARDIPAVVEEPMMPPERPIAARVEFHYLGEGPPASDPPDRYWGYYAKKWEGEVEHYIDKKKALDQELSKIISPGDAPEVKLRKIYAAVLQIRNLDMEDYKTAKEHKDENLKENSNVEDVLEHGYAYERQINLLFVGLARAAGFDATAVYIAPRNQDLFVPNLNSVRQLSDDVVWARAGSQEYYLDPGSRYFPFGLLPWYETECGGIRADKRSGQAVTTPAARSSDATTVRNADLEVKEDGSISGVLSVDFTGAKAALIREEKRKEDDVGKTKDFEDDVKAWLPTGSEFSVTKIANWDDIDKPVHVEGTIKMTSFATGAAQRMLLPLEIFQMSQMRDFASEKRSNFVYFHHPYEETDDIKLRVPAGYKVESVPPDRKVNLGVVSYEITAGERGNAVEVKRHLVVDGVVFKKEEYSVLRRFFGNVKTSDSAQLVLQNATSAHN
jgi:hypothetical protein